MTKENLFKKSRRTITMGIFALVGGFYFLNKQLTGSVISEKSATFSLLPLIGLLLIACSAVLIIYSIKKK